MMGSLFYLNKDLFFLFFKSPISSRWDDLLSCGYKKVGEEMHPCSNLIRMAQASLSTSSLTSTMLNKFVCAIRSTHLREQLTSLPNSPAQKEVLLTTRTEKTLYFNSLN
jgi:hypothetical protein